MAKILLVTQKGESLFLADRLLKEGHEVTVYASKNIESPQEFSVSFSGNWRVPANESDLIIFDSPGMGGVGSFLRRQGRTVLNGGRFSDLIALDFDFAEKAGALIKIPHYSGEEEGDYILVEGWFNGDRFLSPFLLGFPKNRLLLNDRGAVTPGMGTTLTTVESCQLIEKSLFAVENLLRKSKFLGVFGILLHMTKSSKVEFISFRPGFSFDALQAFGELLKGSWTEHLIGFCNKDLKSLKVWRGKWSVSVRLSIPPYPFQAEFRPGNWPILPEGAEKHFWPSSPEFDGVLGTITAWGETVREAQRRIDRTLERTKMSREVQFRTDISDRVEDTYKRLQSGGYVNGKPV